MTNPEWGTKRQCPSCGTRFYDLGKEPPLKCVKCDCTFVPELVIKAKKPRLVIKYDEADMEAELREDDDFLPDSFEDALGTSDAFDDDSGTSDDMPIVRRVRDDADIVPDDDTENTVLDEDLPDNLPDDDVDDALSEGLPPTSGKKKRRS